MVKAQVFLLLCKISINLSLVCYGHTHDVFDHFNVNVTTGSWCHRSGTCQCNTTLCSMSTGWTVLVDCCVFNYGKSDKNAYIIMFKSYLGYRCPETWPSESQSNSWDSTFIQRWPQLVMRRFVRPSIVRPSQMWDPSMNIWEDVLTSVIFRCSECSVLELVRYVQVTGFSHYASLAIDVILTTVMGLTYLHFPVTEASARTWVTWPV